MVTYVFREVSVKAVYKWVDATGKRRQKTKKFSQTLNPFNRNMDGSLKSPSDILKAVNEEKAAWLESMRRLPE